MTRAALIGLALLASTAHAEAGTPRSPVSEQIHTYEYQMCGKVMMILVLSPDKPPQVIREYRSNEHKKRIDAMRAAAQENGNAHRFKIDSSRCPEI